MSFAYLALFTGDYLRDTRHLTPLKHGVYLLLLMHCWDQKGPLPLDEQECAGVANCRSADEIESLRYVLERYFVRMEDGYYNPRMQREIEKMVSVSSARSEAGRKGFEARAKQLPSKRRASAKQVPLSSSPSSSLSSTPSSSSSPPPEVQTIPAWLPVQAWSEYLQHRRAKRAVMTAKAVELQIENLNQLRLQGDDPRAVIERSIANGWTGLFPLQHSKPTGQPGIEQWARNQEKETE